MRNFMLLAALPLMATFAPVCAVAQQAGWDGTWTGQTAKGGDISITISGNSATEYVFRGQSVPINQSAGTKKTFQLSVGQLNSTVRLTMAGANKARYSYSDSQGGSATGSVMRQ